MTKWSEEAQSKQWLGLYKSECYGENENWKL
jgi:hypothetical protein